MTFPSDDQGERPGGPWSQQPQYPPSYRPASYPHHPGQPRYDDTGYDDPGYPPPRDPGCPPSGYPPSGYPEPGQPGYPEPGQPGYPEPGQPGYPEPGQPGYPEPGQPGYPGAAHPRYPDAGEHGYQSSGEHGYQSSGEHGYQSGGEPGYVQADPRDYRPPYEIPGVTGTEGVPESTSATRSRRTAGPHNTQAFTGLVLGILGLLASFLAPVLAIVFGVTGLTRIRRTGQRGGTLAITAILLGVMWIAATALFAVLVIRNEGYGSVAALRAGSCFDNAQPGHVAVRVRYLSSCAQPHNGEVVGTFALPGTAWPGQQTVTREAATGCAALLTSVLGQQTLSSGVRGMNYSPDQQAWSAGTRAVSCVLLDPTATHTGSMIGGS
jgi:hypothetical protein